MTDHTDENDWTQDPRAVSVRRPYAHTYQGQIVAPIWSCSHRHRDPVAAFDCAHKQMRIEGIPPGTAAGDE